MPYIVNINLAWYFLLLLISIPVDMLMQDHADCCRYLIFRCDGTGERGCEGMRRAEVVWRDVPASIKKYWSNILYIPWREVDFLLDRKTSWVSAMQGSKYRNIYRVLIKYCDFFQEFLVSEHSAAICCTKNYQPIGVTVHSHCVASFEGLFQRCRRGRVCSEFWIFPEHTCTI